MSEIEHVSDTAFWVAAYRAQESERPDAVFRDPLASVLVGERGRAIDRRMPRRRLMSFLIVVRTSAIDRLILQAIAQGVDTVLNLGAGLDTRPYRLSLPASLRWIEADFPALIRHKDETLARETPVCALERVGLDLSDQAARQALLRRVCDEASSALVITEGVIPYLKDEDVASLAEDLRGQPKIRYWIQDYYSAQARRYRPSWRKKMKAAPFLFRAPDWFGFFARFGFQPAERVNVRQAYRQIGRPPPFVFPRLLIYSLMPAKWQEKAAENLGYVLLERREP
jgi:methyltransferase (TIGR00027 family)